MLTYSLPPSPRALIFDLDSTLYTHEDYARFQNRVLVERLASARGESFERTEAALETLKAERRAAKIGDSSLGNLFATLGIPIATSVAWREELIHPEGWLTPDPRLALALDRLAGDFRLALVTNNPRSVGEASLRVLGVRSSFELVIGLDDSLRSKPDPASFRLALERLGAPAEAAISIGDRYSVDIEPALGLGMGGILVTCVDEVYELPVFFGIST
jgi:phosphoglycolate phosphatase/putative hydrolase of the HAD superfamily